MYTSRFTFGWGQNDPETEEHLIDRYLTIVDHAPDANHDRNTRRMHELWGPAFAFPYNERQWEAMDSRYRDMMVEHARFEFGLPYKPTESAVGLPERSTS